MKKFLIFLFGLSLSVSADEPKQDLASSLNFMSGMGHSVNIGAEKEVIDGYVFVDSESIESKNFLIDLKKQADKKYIVFFTPTVNNLNSTFDALYIMDAFNKKSGFDSAINHLIVEGANISKEDFESLNQRIADKDETLIKLYAMLSYNKKIIEENNLTIPALIEAEKN